MAYSILSAAFPEGPSATVFHDLQELGLDGESLEHADVRATRIAGGNGSDDGPHGAKHDTRSLPEDCGGFTAVDRNPEHQPVRQDVRNRVLLAEDMSALEMNKRLVVLVLADECPGRGDFPLERLALYRVHGGSWESRYTPSRTLAWSALPLTRTMLISATIGRNE